MVQAEPSPSSARDLGPDPQLPVQGTRIPQAPKRNSIDADLGPALGPIPLPHCAFRALVWMPNAVNLG